ncbi:AraC family transcriptional regulator [Jannaschia marina]|uniref:AraC family transcriptional regulator n=1 Tax=Jannaschia marina TaxID=2741674 RepID=UPI0015C84D36|nr:helix-turn-helix domain-containing protein [Jannaschia marina]
MPTLPIPVFVALVLGFACLRLWMEQRRLGALGLLLGICAVQSLIIAMAQHYMVPGMRWMQPIGASLIPPAAWFAYTVTAVRPAGRVDVLHGLVPLAAVAAILVAPRFLDVLLPGAFVGYGIAILVQALRGADAQPRALLAYGNIPARIWLIIGAALIASALSDVLIVLAQIAGRGELRVWFITVFSVGNLLLIGLFSLSPYLRNDETEKPEPVGERPEPDAELWERVTAYMAREKPYLDPNLTLSRLARKLRVPAKTLSVTINRATGENVSRFVNEARIGNAKATLMRGETVTEAMLSSGFNTKSNFNREFLRVAGSSPSDWLQAEGRAICKST